MHWEVWQELERPGAMGEAGAALKPELLSASVSSDDCLPGCLASKGSLVPPEDTSVRGPHEDGVPQIIVQLENSSGSVAMAGIAPGHSGGTRWRGDDCSLSVMKTTEEP